MAAPPPLASKATLEQAEAARKAHAESLARLGAHAVLVEKAGPGWCVVAHALPDAALGIPAKLATEVAGEVVDVPVKLIRSRMAKPG